jgi:hypothetical protein
VSFLGGGSRRGVCVVDGWGVLETPFVTVPRGVRVNDCGPEPSLRTSPSSSSLLPTATAFRFPRAYRRPAHPGGPPRRALPAAISRQLGRTVCLGFSPIVLSGGGSCGARSRPAARAAFGSIRSVLRREDAGCIQRVTYRRCMTHDGLRAMDVPVLRTDLPRSTHPTQAIDVGGGVVHLRRMGEVRSGRRKHTGVCRTKPIIDARHHDGLRASGHRTNDTRCVCQLQPPARLQFGGPRSTRH